MGIGGGGEKPEKDIRKAKAWDRMRGSWGVCRPQLEVLLESSNPVIIES